MKGCIAPPSVVVFFLFLALASTIHAHTLTLKNGQVVKGKIVNVTKTEIHIKVKDEIKIFSKSQVLEVDYSDTDAVVKPVVPVKKVTPVEPEKKDIPEEEVKRPLNQYDLVWRSALIPGWGQYRVKKKMWAYSEGALTFAALAYALGERNKALDQQKVYEASVSQNFLLLQATALPGANPADAIIKQFFLSLGPYNSYQTQVNKYNQSIQILAVFYLGQAAHSWFLGKKNASSETPVMTFNFGVMPDSLTSGKVLSFAGMQYRF